MSTHTRPIEDVIELMEIVEEGISLDKKFEGFDTGKVVDAKSLNQEPDDLLCDADPRPKAAQKTTDEIDLDILFDETEPVAEKPRPSLDALKMQPLDPGMDLSDLDGLFDSLGIGEKEDGCTALDIILDGDIPDPKTQGAETFYPFDSSRDILDHIEARGAELASSSKTEEMQAPLNDPKIQVGSLPDIENELTKTAASMQKMKTELADLRALVRVQDASLISLRQALADRDASIAALSAGEKRLREDLEAMARTDTAPAMAEIKDELREYVQQQVPLAAAKIIREEIATLIKELEG